jgi:hypothetical protein
VILILVYSLSVFAILISRGVSVFRFDAVYTLSMLFGSTIWLLPIINYPEQLDLRIAGLIILAHVAIVGGFNFPPNNTLPSNYPHGVNEAFVGVLTIATVIFVVLQLLSLLLDGKIPILSNLVGVEIVRSDHTYETVERGGLASFSALMSHFGFLFVVLFPTYSRRTLQFLALLAGILIVDLGFSSGGRANLVFLLISLLTVYLSKTRISVKRLLFITAFIVPLAYVLAGEFYLARNPNFGHAADFYLQYNCAGATYHDFIDRSPPTVKAASLSLCYFSSPPFYFEIFMLGSGWKSEGLGGVYNLGAFFREEFVFARIGIAHVMSSFGVGVNPWATIGRDFFIDFGYFFPIPLFFLGAWFRLLVARPEMNSEVFLSRTGLLAAAGFLAANMSPFVARALLYPILIAALLPLVLKIFLRK